MRKLIILVVVSTFVLTGLAAYAAEQGLILGFPAANELEAKTAQAAKEIREKFGRRILESAEY